MRKVLDALGALRERVDAFLIAIDLDNDLDTEKALTEGRAIESELRRIEDGLLLPHWMPGFAKSALHEEALRLASEELGSRYGYFAQAGLKNADSPPTTSRPRPSWKKEAGA